METLACAKVKVYSAEEAIKESRKMREQGWPQARVQKYNNDGYCVIGHAAGCYCGHCPVMHTDGYVQ
jgi:hypothetical protein